MKKQNGRSSRFGLHRAAYHRHFEGYSEYEVVDENGYAHIKRVYTGMYYTHPLEGRRRVLLKALFSALWAAAAVLFVLAAAQRGVAATALPSPYGRRSPLSALRGHFSGWSIISPRRGP